MNRFIGEGTYHRKGLSYPCSAVDWRQQGEGSRAKRHDDPIRIAPYVPTPPETVRTMLMLAEASEKDTLIDLGCGDGRILLSAVMDFNVRQAIGYEIDPELCRQVNALASEQGLDERVKAINQDMFKADLSGATIVTMYLTTAGNERIKPKLEKETKPGTRLVSHDFTISDWVAERVLTTDTDALNPHRIYSYRNPQSFSKQGRSQMNAILHRILRRLFRLGLGLHG